MGIVIVSKYFMEHQCPPWWGKYQESFLSTQCTYSKSMAVYPVRSYLILETKTNRLFICFKSFISLSQPSESSIFISPTTHFRYFSVLTMATGLVFRDLLWLTSTQLFYFKTISLKSRHTAFDKIQKV